MSEQLFAVVYSERHDAFEIQEFKNGISTEHVHFVGPREKVDTLVRNIFGAKALKTKRFWRPATWPTHLGETK